MNPQNPFSLKLAGVALACFCLTSPSQAASLLSHPEGGAYQSGSMEFGYKFTLSATSPTLQITSLGIFDGGNSAPYVNYGGDINNAADTAGDGLLDSHTIYLYSGSTLNFVDGAYTSQTPGTLLASATIAAGIYNNEIDQYVYTSDLTFEAGFNGQLTAGTSYILSASYIQYTDPNSHDRFAATTVPTVSEVSSIAPAYRDMIPVDPSKGTPWYPGTVSAGPNLQFTVVPEPSTWVSLLSGLGALVGFRAFRRRA